MNTFEILIILGAILIGIILVSFAVKNVKKMEEEAVTDLQDSQAKGENVFMPEEYNNVSLGVGSGIRFGFGFGIGLFFAGLIITIILTAFFGLTTASLVSNLAR